MCSNSILLRRLFSSSLPVQPRSLMNQLFSFSFSTRVHALRESRWSRVIALGTLPSDRRLDSLVFVFVFCTSFRFTIWHALFRIPLCRSSHSRAGSPIVLSYLPSLLRIPRGPWGRSVFDAALRAVSCPGLCAPIRI